MSKSSQTLTPSALPTAGGMYASTPAEFGPEPLQVLSGQLPAGLRGTIFRNGPARFERGGRRVGHLFDGDGAILRVGFDGTGASGSYRYVRTAGYLAEEQAGKLIFGGFGTRAQGGLLSQFTQSFKNPANTSVLALKDKLLALWEGGEPHALDPRTLATIGPDMLDGLRAGQSFSAHPKRDPLSGEVYNFGTAYGKDFGLDVYRCDGASGRILQQKRLRISGFGQPMVHDFVLAGPYLVFLLSPVLLDLFSFLPHLKTYSDALEWRPEKGTRIVIVDRQSLELVAQNEAESWFQWHFGNGSLEADGSLRLDLVAYSDFATNQGLSQRFREPATSLAAGYLTRLRLNPHTGELLEKQQLMTTPGEFPVVKPAEAGQPWTRTWLTLSIGPAAEIVPNTLACYDHAQDQASLFTPGEDYSVSEPLYAADAGDASRGWLVDLVYNQRAGRSEVWIFDAQALTAGPVCTLALPGTVPLTFHGNWQDA